MAEAAETRSLRDKQQAQEKARALAGELVSAVLDTQIRQLEENGLAGLPVYRDITSMKGSLQGLMKGEMEAIVKLLVEAQQGPPEVRLAKLNAARASVRDVVVQLMAERQKLNRRMKITRLSADARQLIGLETKVHSTTKTLPQYKQDEREQLALATIEDQADVQKLYLHLIAALQDVSTWGGQVGAGASDGLRIVKAAQVEPELRNAGQSLGRADFQAAATSQQAAIRGLIALVEKLEETQGLIDSDRAEALRLVHQMRQRQHDLRERTKTTDVNQRTSEPLIEGQTSIQKELGKLAEGLAKFSNATPLFEAAKAASFEATAQLFDDKKQPALDEQGRVIGNLAQIEKLLEQGLDLDRSNKSADELAAEVRRLEELKQQLASALREQLQVAQNAADNPTQASQHEKSVAEKLAQTDALGEFPSATSAKLNDAKEEVEQAQTQLAKSAPEAAESRKAAVEAALTALKRAQAEAAAQLADSQRRQKAVEVGELARAAEAIERAAAAERAIAKATAEAASEMGLAPKETDALLTEQQDVAEVAEKIAEGVKNTAPSVTQLLGQAQPFIAATAKHLYAARQQPGESSRPAAKQASGLAGQAAEQLTKAAAELRQQARHAAEQLAKIADEQFTQVEAARQAVETAADAAKQSAAEAILKLQQARQRGIEAISQQAKAVGKGREAAARQLAERIAEALRQQDEADQAAQDLMRGRANSPLAAAAEQQEVADLAGELAKQAAGDVAGALRSAGKSAGEAAKETLGGSPSRAESARRQTRESLTQAARAAEEMAKKAADAPLDHVDVEAQAKAGEKAGEAQQLVREAVPVAGRAAEQAIESLAEARAQSAIARQKIEGKQPAAAGPAQQAASHALAAAVDQIDQALRELAHTEAEKLAEASGQLGGLEGQAEQVDPGAAAALNQAQQAAQRGARAKGQPTQVARARQEVQREIEQAEANLAARGQQLRRDRDMAETLAGLTNDQQIARDAIARAASQLEELTQAPSASEGSSLEKKPSPLLLAAAQALHQAQQQFATAMRATGEGAAAASGQQEVANQPIREGLEIASGLNQPASGAVPAEGQAAADGQPMNPGQPAGQGQPTGQPGQEQTAQGQPPGQGQPGKPSGPGGQPQPSALGTGFVPASPEATAKQVAGPKANAAASAVMMAMASQIQGEGQGEQPGQGEGKSESPMPGEASATAKKGGAVKGGKSKMNEKQPPGELQVADAAEADSRGELANQDAAAGIAKLEHESWFAKLPPTLRSAIQAKSRGKAPRGYEERLRRYFESVD